VAQTSYGRPLDGEKKKVRCHLINCILMHAKVVIVSDRRGTIRLQYALGLKTASKWMHHRSERARKPRKPLRFEEEPCSWTVHEAVRDSIERELVLPAVTRRQSRSIKAESFLRLLDTLFQIMDPWGRGSTPHRSKFIKYTNSIAFDTVLLAD